MPTNQTTKPTASDAPTCSAWIPAANPPKTAYTRVIAKAETEDVGDAFWLESPKPGFYFAIRGGVRLWPYVTHWIPWPEDAQEGICPQCGEQLIQPRDSEKYCEECGWPDENREDDMPNAQNPATGSTNQDHEK